MANEALIKGETLVGQTSGFYDYGSAYTPLKSNTAAVMQEAYAKEEAKKQEIQSKTNARIANMKDLGDLTGLSNDEQGALLGYLRQQRAVYSEAASAAARINDYSDPQYQVYVDQMNAVNNSIQNLAGQVKAYKEARTNYADMHEAGQFSGGNSADDLLTASTIYGFGDASTGMTVTDGGNLGFDLGNGNIVDYSKYDGPLLKDFATADAIMKRANSLYTTGAKLTDINASMVRNELKATLQNPKTLQSLLSTDFDLDGLKIDVVYDPNDIDGTREATINAIMNAYTTVAEKGYREKVAASKPRGGNSGGGSSGTTESEYTLRIDDAIVTADNNLKKDGSGNEYGIGTPFNLKGVKYTPYVFVQPAVDADGNTIEGRFTKKYVFKYTVGGREQALTYKELMNKI